MKFAAKSFFFPVIAFLLLTVVYFFTRLVLIKNLPLFVDEVTYIHWAQLGFFDPNLRLTSLGDGKQPLFIWLIILVMQVIHNPVIAGRVAGILSGFGTAIGIYVLSNQLFKNKWIALWSTLIYIFSPFALSNNRRAMYDSLVAMLAIWSMYFSVLLVKRIQLGNAFLLAFSLGAGILNKSSGFLSIYCLPLTLILFEKGKNTSKRFLLWGMYAVIAVLLSYVFYSVLFLSSDFSTINTKNELFINSPLSILHTNFLATFLINLSLFSQWIFLLFTPFFLLLVCIGWLGDFKKEKLLLLATFLVEILSFALLAKDPAPRYIYPMVMLLVPIAGYGMFAIQKYFKKNILLFSFSILFLFSFALYSDYQIITNLENAPIPSISKISSVTGWSSGEGIGEITKYLLTQSQKHHIMVITDGKYGSLSTGAMDLYFFNNPAVDRLALDTFSSSIPQEVLDNAKIEPVYLFINQIQTPIPWKISLIMKFEKGHGTNYVYLYQLSS